MLAALRHRGPDDRGEQWIPQSAAAPPSRGVSTDAPDVVLLHTRLAILDLSPAGHQPMNDLPLPGGVAPNWIVFNGEVYNFLELQRELASAGWPCHTRCDTEVILRGYRAWGGPECVRRMRGMFAWCLVDPINGTAWLCRDRLGIKPMYIVRPPSGGLLFASELRVLLAAGPDLVPRRIRQSAVESFLAQGAVIGPDAIVDGVEMIPPGSSLVVDWAGREMKSGPYWSLPFVPSSPAGAEEARGRHNGISEAVEALHGTVRDAVKLELISDVPLGLFLSGGIDSGSLATLAAEVAGTQVRTISIGFDDPVFDESAAAAEVARAIGTDHRAVRITGEGILTDIPQVLAATDQPTVDGFNTYFVSRAARESGLTVALSGLGGDELFAGYSSFRYVPRAARLQRALGWMGPCRPMLGGIARLFGGRGRGAVKAEEMFHRQADPLQMYLLRRELFLPEERRLLLPCPPVCHPRCGLQEATLRPLSLAAQGLDPINQVCLFELQLYMRHMLLRDGDVFSMTHGLEVRFPLLDHKLVEQTVALPGALKRPHPHPKSLLTRAVGPRLPQDVYRRPKRGFTFPWDTWLRGPLHDWSAELVADSPGWTDLGIERTAPQVLWQRFLKGDSRVAALQILALIVLRDFSSRLGLHV
jgi:asparagine synthase (glutamine-hydrolysing)